MLGRGRRCSIGFKPVKVLLNTRVGNKRGLEELQGNGEQEGSGITVWSERSSRDVIDHPSCHYHGGR